jgi:hypothetical protein
LTGTEEIVTGYFDTAFTRGDQDIKILELQKLLTRVQLYTGALDSTYSDELIAAIYGFQNLHGVLAGHEDEVSLR